MDGYRKGLIGALALLAFDVTAWEAAPISDIAHDLHHSQPAPHSPADEVRRSGKNIRKDRIPADFRRELHSAMALATAKQYPQAAQALSRVIARPAFREMPKANQHATLAVAGWVAIQLGEYEHARDLYLRATAVDASDPDDGYYLSQLESALGDEDAAARHLLRLAKSWPERLDDLDDGFILQLQNSLEPASPLRLDLLQSLYDAGWDRKQLGADELWYELALIRVRRGEMDLARAATERITRPLELVKLRSDRRFDALVDARAPAFDVTRAAQQRVAHLRGLAGKRPKDLQLLAELGGDMLTAGLHQEVLALTEATLSAIRDAPPDDAPFQDMESQVWIMNDRAVALRRLGRVEEAVAELQRASKLSEDGQVNVSQALNLGQFYCNLGRPDDALAAIEVLGRMSGYGRMVQASVQHRAAVQKGDRASANMALAYIRKHRNDSQAIWLETLIEADRMEEAARTLVELLASPVERGEALSWLQQFAEPEPLPGQAETRARWRALAERPEVRAAVARVGRIQRYEIYSGYGN